tara:strand:- start:79 stop:609 length:531 start_codon:yes stop_codon:yes gene_type:complete
MTIQYKTFIQSTYEEADEWIEIERIAKSFYDYLSTSESQKELSKVNIPGAKSQRIEEVITPYAESIGFTSQKRGLFKKYNVSKLTPDYFRPLSKTGIIIEVERGQTTQNNAALKDLWKVHICEEAHYLFLFVPNLLIQNEKGKIAGKPFNETVNRLSPFFEEENYTNARGLVIFGY